MPTVDPTTDRLSTLDPSYRWVVGAAIFRTPPPGKQAQNSPQILLVKRSATERTFAHHWEIPGGGIDYTDNSVWDALRREVSEETGLSATEIVGYVDEVEIPAGDRKFIRLTYIVRVGRQDGIVLDPEEHQDFAWTSEEEAEGMLMTDQMRLIVRNAFQSPKRSGTHL